MTPDFERTLQPAVNIPEGFGDYIVNLCRVGALGYMSSAIMHEISNALTVISGNVQIIQLKNAGQEKKDILRRMPLIMDQIARIEATIARVGSFGARLNGKLKETDPIRALNNALYAFKKRCIFDGPEIRFAKQNETCTIQYDPSLIEYVLLEMFSLFLTVCNSKDHINIKSSVKEASWSVEADLTLEPPPSGKADFWSSEELPMLAAGTLFVLKKYGGEVTLRRSGNVLGWRLDVPLAVDHD